MSPDANRKEGVDGSDDPDSYDDEVLAADLRTLVTRIEGLHPEPYNGYEGRLALHAALESTVRDLPDAATTEEFFRLAAPLVAGLEDAHSRLVPPEREDGDQRLPVSLRLVGDALYVDGVYDESLREVLGARLLGVDGESVDAMADRYARLRGSENGYFVRMALADRVEAHEWFGRLLDEPTAPDSPTVRVRTADGREVGRSLDPVPEGTDPVEELERAVDAPEGTGPRYDLYDGGEVAVFVPGDLMCYREVVEGARERNAGYTESIARDAYATHFDDDPPGSVEAIVPELPSMIETLTDMVREMDGAGTDSLVVDLRDNPGGDSRFVQYLGYVMFGLEAVAAGSDWAGALKRRTEAHQERYGVPEGANDEYATFEGNPAGYDFGTRFRSQEQSTADRVATLEDRLASGTFADELDDRTHEAYHEPGRLVVATTAGTMSSGFAGAALLSELGADVVGVPSGQAPLSFGEALEVTLPNTGLTAEISGSLYRWTRDSRADVLPMARELTPELFEDRYDRAGDASLQLALEWARGGEPPQ